MRTVFSQLEVWVSKEKISMTSSKKPPILRISKDSIVINPEKYVCAVVESFSPLDELSEKDKITMKYLDANNLEIFDICMVGVTIRNIVKPKDVPLEEYLK